MRPAISGAPRILTAWVVAVSLCWSGCEGDGPEMRPGEPCLGCHQVGSGDAAEEHPFSFAGTVYASAEGGAPAEGVSTTVVDATYARLTVISNAAGNFFSESALIPPLKVSLARGAATLTMGAPASSGDCNRCHRPGGEALGRLRSP